MRFLGMVETYAGRLGPIDSPRGKSIFVTWSPKIFIEASAWRAYKIINRLDTPHSLNKATTATGSVAEIKAPNSNAIMIGTSNESHSQNPTRNSDITSPGTASTSTGSRFFNKPLASRHNADSKTKAGKKRIKPIHWLTETD